MRGLLIALLIAVWLPFAVFKPHVGILVWDWISHMNPHKQAYGFAQTFNFLDYTAILTILGIVIGKDQKRLPMHPIVILFFLYLFWVIVTTLLGYLPSYSINKLTQFFKVILFASMSILVMQSPNRLRAFVWVMALSMAFIGVKGGLFTVFTGGTGRVQGAGGMMTDNNQLAMAMAMTVPILLYLSRFPPHPKLRLPFLAGGILTMVSILGTQSRGGFAAIAAVTFMMLLKTKRKIAMIALLIPLAIGAYAFMPDSYRNRIKSSENATEDSSFMGRVVMWRFSSNVADDNPIEGGGFDVFYVKRAQELYMPPGHTPRAPHSSYFEVLAEHGYTGLLLFLTILFTGYYSAGTNAKRYRQYEETAWIGEMCAAIQLSIIGYAVGSLTVNIATFDYFYHMLAVVVMCSVVGEKIILKGETTARAAKGPADQPKQPKSKKWSPYNQPNRPVLNR